MITWLRQDDGSPDRLPGSGAGRRQKDRILQKAFEKCKCSPHSCPKVSWTAGEMSHLMEQDKVTQTPTHFKDDNLWVSELTVLTFRLWFACLLQRWMEMTPTEGLGNTAEVNQGHCCYEFISCTAFLSTWIYCPWVWPFTQCTGTQLAPLVCLLQKALQDFCSVSPRCTANHTAGISSAAKTHAKT